MGDIFSLIAEVGFPIVGALAAGYFVFLTIAGTNKIDAQTKSETACAIYIEKLPSLVNSILFFELIKLKLKPL